MYTEVDDRPLARLDDLLLDLLAHTIYHLLNASRVDTSVLYQLVQS